MPFYLSEYIGAGTKEDSFVPVGSDQPGWTGIDIRPDASRQDGGGLNACLLHVPLAFSDPRARFLADDKLESLTNPQKNFLTNKLGVDLSSPTLLRDIIATLMNSPPANGWKPIRPTRLRWEIHLGGELLWEAPRLSGGASDNFNRADETPLAAPWTSPPYSGLSTINLTSNAIQQSGDACMYYTAAASTEDQYSQVDAGFLSSASGGPAVRCGADSSVDCYQFDNFNDAVQGEIRKWLNGSSSLLEDAVVNRANPIRIEAEGSTIGTYANGVLSAEVTDTGVTGGQPGMFIYDGPAPRNFDNWSGDDLVEPAGDGLAWIRA